MTPSFQKKKLLVSFSGGRTSAYMTKWILDNWSDEYEIKVVFANTGKEREETLEFVLRCDLHFGFNTLWIEAVVNPEMRQPTNYRIVNFDTCSRQGQPFEEVIRKYGIPNVSFPHCTRELKTQPIQAFAKEYWGKGYYTAIGIRADEIDRIDAKRREKKYLYPLVEAGITRDRILEFWKAQAFDLELKGYEGNCNKCFKKGASKT